MRILFLTSPGENYQEDLVFDGLVRAGHLVEDRPRKPAYHGERGGAEKYSQCWFEHEPMDLDREPDLLVAGTRSPLEPVRELRKAAPGRIPLVVLDGEDDERIRKRWLREADIYFKRELSPREARKRRRCLPLPFAGSEPAGLRPLAERTHDLCFLASATHPLREQVFEALRGMGNPRAFLRIDTHPEVPLGYREYRAVLADSRIGVSVRGAGFDTMRYWDILSHGAVLVSERPSIVIPDDFRDMEDAIYFDSVPEMIEKVGWALEDRHRLERIRAAGLARLRAFHTTRRRAEYLIARVEAVLGGAGRRGRPG